MHAEAYTAFVGRKLFSDESVDAHAVGLQHLLALAGHKQWRKATLVICWSSARIWLCETDGFHGKGV